MPARTRRKLGKKYGFQKGRISEHRGKKLSSDSQNVANHRYIRLTKESFDSRVNITENTTFTCQDVDGTDNNVTVLRAVSRRRKLTDDSAVQQYPSVHPDLLTNKIYRPYEVQNMFNTEMKNHRKYKQNCNGDMEIDAAASRKWGLCWSERLTCTRCSYTGQYYKLYEEVPSNKRDRKVG